MPSTIGVELRDSIFDDQTSGGNIERGHMKTGLIAVTKLLNSTLVRYASDTKP